MVARPGDLISLVGDLGAGKTQFAKGFGAGLDAAEAMAGGLIDERQGEGVTLIEWAERLADAMPAGHLDVLIDGAGDDPRRITVRAGDMDYDRYLAAVDDRAADTGTLR